MTVSRRAVGRRRGTATWEWATFWEAFTSLAVVTHRLPSHGAPQHIMLVWSPSPTETPHVPPAWYEAPPRYLWGATVPPTHRRNKSISYPLSTQTSLTRRLRPSLAEFSSGGWGLRESTPTN